MPVTPTLGSYAILTAVSAYSRQCQLVPAPELASSFMTFGSYHCEYPNSCAYTADVRPSAEVAGLGTDAGIQTIKFRNYLESILCSLSLLALCQLLSSALAPCSLISASSIIIASSVSIPSCFSGAVSHSFAAVTRFLLLLPSPLPVTNLSYSVMKSPLGMTTGRSFLLDLISTLRPAAGVSRLFK